MSTKILDAVRAKYPQYTNIDDAELTKRLVDKYPQYLKDEEFAKSAMPMLSDEQRAGVMTMRASELPKTSQGVSTIAGGPPKSFGGSSFMPANDYAESGRIIPKDPTEALSAPSVWAKRGGTLLLGAMADLASTMKGEPGTANMDAFSVGEEMPVEIGLKEMHGLSSVPTKAAAGLIQAAPAIGLSGGLAMTKAPSAVAAALPMLTDHEGQIDPYGALIAAGLPGVSRTAEKFVGSQLAKLPTAHVVAAVLSRDPLKIKAKVVQRLGGLEISNDVFRKYLEAGGGAVAANAYLLASQAPQILSLPPEQRGEAILDSVAANLGVSMLAFSSRPGASETLRELQPKLRKLWEQTQNERAVGGKPAANTSAGAAQPSTAPVPPLPVAEAAPAVPTVPTVPPTINLRDNDSKLIVQPTAAAPAPVNVAASPANVGSPAAPNIATAPAPKDLTASTDAKAMADGENAKSAETPAAPADIFTLRDQQESLMQQAQKQYTSNGKRKDEVVTNLLNEIAGIQKQASQQTVPDGPLTPENVSVARHIIMASAELLRENKYWNDEPLPPEERKRIKANYDKLKQQIDAIPEPKVHDVDFGDGYTAAYLPSGEQVAFYKDGNHLFFHDWKSKSNGVVRGDAIPEESLVTELVTKFNEAQNKPATSNQQPAAKAGKSSTPSEPAPTVPTPTSPQAGSATATSSTAPAELQSFTPEQIEAIYKGIEPDRDWKTMSAKVAELLNAKDVEGLRKWVMHGKGFNDSTKAAVFKSIGGKFPKNQDEMGRRLDEWAGITPEQRAAIEKTKADKIASDNQAKEDAARIKKEQERLARIGPDLVAFTAGMEPMVAGRVESVLTKQVAKRSGGKTFTGTAAEVVKQLVADGWGPLTHEGKKTEYRLQREDSFFIVTKAEHDFAKWLKEIADKPENAVTPAAPAKPATPAPSTAGTLAEHIRQLLLAGGDLLPKDVRALAAQAGLTEKEAAEWAELGATLAARDLAQNPDMTPREKFAALVSLYNRMPTNGERTVDTKVKQQYSTPPPLAYAAQVLADFGSGTVFVEPTAGHGMLMIAANPEGAVAFNELDENREQRLRLMAGNFKRAVITSHDATGETFHKLAAGTKPDRVGMNPPFGSVLGMGGKNKKFPIFNASTKQKETTSIDAAIMLNMFDALTPTGKGFAIIGAKTGNMYATMADDKTRAEDYNKPVFLDLFNRFNVVDWFTIGGDLYRKMGAAWPVDVIVVHGKGKTPGAANGGMVRPWIKPPRVIETWEDLAKLLPEQSYDNIKSGATGGKAGASPSGTRSATPPERSGGRGNAKVSDEGYKQPAADSGAGRGDQPQTSVVPNPTPEPPQGVNAVTSAGIGTGTPETGGSVAGSGAKPSQPGTPAVGGRGPLAAGPSATESGRKPVAEKSGASSQKSEVKPSVPVEGMPAALAVPYKGASRGPSLNLVAPRNIAEAMLKAQQDLEQQTGKSIDQFLAEKLLRTPAILHAQLAGAQIDTAALAVRNIENGGGLICAHQTGVGKGRIVAALIEYCKARGLVVVFVTAKKNLYEDMVARDLPNLGRKDFIPFITDTTYTYEDGHGKVVKGRGTAAQRAQEMENVIRTGQLPNGAHGVFTTYDQLKGDKPAGFKETPKDKFKRQVNKEERPDGPRWAMLRALAPRAVFILDEAHEAAGPTSEINRKFTSVLPPAHGVYYSSATFAKRPDNLGIYALGTSIKNAGLDNEALAEALKAGGVPLQQALTSMLADSGELVRCEQDWTGVPFSFKQTSADESKDVEAADTYTSFIRDLMQLAKVVNVGIKSLEDGENQVRAEEQEVSVEPITFGSRLFNLSNQYLLALRSDAIVREAIAELKAGRKPFIALYNTMEGPLLDLKARKLPLSFNGILLREMQKMLVITVKDPTEKSGEKKVELKPEDLPDGGAFYRQLEAQIMGTDFSRLPISPIDHIKKELQRAGYKVGELTARDGEVNDEGGEITISKREKLERNQILKNYNHGHTDVIIVNGSGSTGLSAHTDPAFKDQRQRVMIVGQPAPDINQFMQMIGRVMRSGQTSKPKYTVLNTALAAERRFATMLRGKMTSLNANTTAEGESGMTQQEGFADDIFNEVGDKVVQRVMEANADLADLMELETGADADGNGPEGFARKATGKFVLLPNADAQRLWDEIISEFKDEIAQLDEQGQNPLRATAEDLKARTLEKTELVQGTGRTAFDGPAVLEKCLVKPPKAPPTHAEAKQRASENLPAIKAAVKAWIDQSFKAQDSRVQTMRQRGSTDKQIEAATKAFENVRELVRQAQWKLGDTWGIDFSGSGVSSYGVAGELKLADKNVADFASASRQHLVLTTNTFKGKLTVPLSKLTRAGDGGDVLQAVDEEDAAEKFNANAESSAERYIVTGNLLRGWEAATNASSGVEGGRPRVAIYTREDGSLATGILMPPNWSGDAAGAASNVTPVTDATSFGDAILTGKTMRGTGAWQNLIEVEGMIVRIKSNMAGRKVWGAPDFKSYFRNTPAQNGSWMVGSLRGDRAQSFFDLLQGAGVTLGIVQPGETSAMKSSGGSGGNAPTSGTSSARGAFVSGVNTAPGTVPPSVTYGGMKFVHPLELPELVRLVRELTGKTPSVRKLPSRGALKTYGTFGDGMITLDPTIFNDSLVAAQVLGHEIGHLVDYLPHETLRRGNLLGHLLALKSFFKGTFGPLNNKELRKELLAVTMWWRPYHPTTDPKSYVQYRESAEELYADALSVLFNAPAELETRAPKFYEAFWKHINARPDVQTALFSIQDLLNKGMLPTAQEREDELLKGFKQGETTWRQAVLDRQQAARSWDGWWTRVGMELYWNFFPLEQRAAQVEKRGVNLPARKDPRVFLDDLGFKDVRVMAWGRRIHEKVIQPLEAAGLTLEDAGKYLFYSRVMAGDRSGLANPGGFTPRAAQLGLLKMNLELKLPKMTLLRDIIRRFHDETFRLAEQAVEVGAYNKQTFDTVIAPNKDAYATFAVLDYLDDYLPPSIRQQIGTFKAIANPFHATILKSIGLINLIEYQKAKNGVVNFINEFYPGDMEKSDAQHEPPAPKGRGIFMRLENGRPVYYITDPFIADAFQKVNSRQLRWFTKAADGIFRKIFYPLFITYNPSFLYFMSPLRDIQRAGRNLPGGRISVGTLPVDYGRNLVETGKRYLGESGPLIREMEANLALGTPFDQIARQHRDDFMGDMLRKMRVLPDHEIQGIYSMRIFQPIRKVLDAMEAGGMTLDALAKTASYSKLRRMGLSPKDAAYFVRNYTGLPNINKKGLLAREARALVPFWNVFIQGWRADVKLMTHPTTRSGWWFRYMMSNGLVRALIAAGAAGALGAAIKELFAGISEYQKTNYLTVPLGKVSGGDFGGKTVFIRIPENETDRMIGGIIYKGVTTLAGDNKDGLSGIFDFGAGQIPSVNPALSVPLAWAQFAAGHNPQDNFRNTPVVPRKNWNAGGWEATQPMLTWTLQQSGALNFFRYDPSANSTMELAVSATPGLNSFVKVSDAGQRERQRKQQDEIQAQRDMQFLKLPDKVQSLELEYWRLQRTPKDTRTEAQVERLNELYYWYGRVYRPAWESILDFEADKKTDLANQQRAALDKESAEFYRGRK